MFSRNTETLVVFTCIAVLSVLSWFVVRQVAGVISGDHGPESSIAERSTTGETTAPPPIISAPTIPATIETATVTVATEMSKVNQLRAKADIRSYPESREISAMNNFLWGVFPYLCIVLFFAVPIIRMLFRPFTWSTRASSLFNRQLLGAASLPLHWGLFLILIGHLFGFFGGVLGIESAITIFYWSGLIGGFSVLIGSIIALYRRLSSPELRAMSQTEDYIVHYFIIAIVGLALYQVLVHQIFGIAYTASSWAASLWTFTPQPELMASASLITKLHVLLALTFFAYFPFTKLVHFWTFPINYFVRPRISMRTQKYRFQRKWEFAFRSDKSWLTYGLATVAAMFLVGGMLLASTSDGENGSVLSGEQLYISQCARCHGNTGLGDGSGANSPTFSAIPRNLVDAQYHFVTTDNGIASDDDLYKVIANGLTNTGMPAFSELTNSQILSLIDVLNEFRVDKPKAGKTLAVGKAPNATAESIARGRTLFQEQCATCHGPTGEGDGEKQVFDYMQKEMRPANLKAGMIKAGRTPEDIFMRMTAGIPGGYGDLLMTRFNQLPESDRWALVHFVIEEILPAESE